MCINYFVSILIVCFFFCLNEGPGVMSIKRVTCIWSRMFENAFDNHQQGIYLLQNPDMFYYQKNYFHQIKLVKFRWKIEKNYSQNRPCLKYYTILWYYSHVVKCAFHSIQVQKNCSETNAQKLKFISVLLKHIIFSKETKNDNNIVIHIYLRLHNIPGDGYWPDFENSVHSILWKKK